MNNLDQGLVTTVAILNIDRKYSTEYKMINNGVHTLILFISSIKISIYVAAQVFRLLNRVDST